MPARILIMDDQPGAVEPLFRALTEDGYNVTLATDAKSAKEAILAGGIDVAIFDIDMTDGRQIAELKRIRRESQLDEYVEEEEQGIRMASWARDISPKMGIAILTKSEELHNTIAGLEAGADIYIEKTQPLRKQIGRIRALARRIRGRPEQIARFGNFELNLHSRILSRGDDHILLTGSEFALLRYLVENPDRIHSREELHRRTFGDNIGSDIGRSIDNLVSKLRKKIGVTREDPEIIQTIYGGGYKIGGVVE